MLDLTLEEIETDFWAHHYHDNPVTDGGEDEDWDTEKVLDMMDSDDWGEWENVLNDRLVKDQS